MKITSETIINKKEKNIGIEILRIYLSFLVVNSHCYKNSKDIKYIFLKIIKNHLHVPTFFLISFFFFQSTLLSRNVEKYKRRFQRLLIPYLVWPVIIWLINNLIKLFFNINLKISFQDLKNQLLTGHCFNVVFWFQWNLIFEVCFFIIIELILHKYLIYILINLGLLSYFFQYSQYNYDIFFKMNFEKKKTFGRIVEIIPYSISGFFISYFKLIAGFQKNRVKTVNTCLFIFILIFKYNFFLEPKGFSYQGLKLNILSSCLFITFSMISNKFIAKNLVKLILQISKFTPGIYYLHIPIMLYFKNIFRVINKKEIYGTIFIYIITFIICIIGNFIFKKNILINLFQ